jgi:hypothetical protein
MKKKQKLDIMQVGSVVKLLSDKRQLTLIDIKGDVLSPAATVAWFKEDSTLMKADVPLRSLRLVK